MRTATRPSHGTCCDRCSKKIAGRVDYAYYRFPGNNFMRLCTECWSYYRQEIDDGVYVLKGAYYLEMISGIKYWIH